MFAKHFRIDDCALDLTFRLFLEGIAYATGQTIIMSVASKYVILVVLALLVVLYFIQHFYLRTSRQVRFLDIELKAPLYSQLIETADGLASVRAFGYEAQARAEHRRILEDSNRAIYTLYCLQRWLILTVDITIAILAVVLAAMTLGLRQQDGAGNIGLALVNLLGLATSVRTILLTWVTMEIAIGAVARVQSFVKNLQLEGAETDLMEPSKEWPSRGDIGLFQISASYNSLSGRSQLENVSMNIRHGEKIALCGRTGSGKTSLLLALLRLLDLDQGKIIIDGVDISRLHHDNVRSQLVAVPQEAFVLDGTVRENLDPASEHKDEELAKVLQKASLQNVIEGLGGLDTAVSDKTFSHGQRQLLSLCRAMLRKGKVILMDEPTSALDHDTTRIVDDLIASWHDATVIVALHKLESLVRYDRVAVLDQGRLVAFDTPEKLKKDETDLPRDLLPPAAVRI